MTFLFEEIRLDTCSPFVPCCHKGTLSIMILLVDTDVRFVTKGYPVCRDETVSGLVCVFLRSIFRICCVLF